jgi:hypothetical protein
MEEELFGRLDIDSTVNAQRWADPMHPERLTNPMRWLVEHPDAWRTECTGVGFNTMTGNYEFASLIVIDDETWWTRHAGAVEANWESSTLRRYSTRDTPALAAPAHDPAWSNEGLFAFLQGLRRLRSIGGDRVRLPRIDVECWCPTPGMPATPTTTHQHAGDGSSATSWTPPPTDLARPAT